MHDVDKSKLTEAFKILRRQGFIARQSFMCCGNCVGNAVALELKAGKHPQAQGLVYYTKQDDEGLREGSSELWLGFGQVECWTAKRCTHKTPLSTKQVGTAVMAALAEAGVKAEWKGDPAEKILVHL